MINKYLPSISAYLIIGVVAALVEWFSFYLAISHNLDYRSSAVMAFVIATFVNYLLCIRFGFLGGRHSQIVEFFLIYLVSAVAFIPNISMTIVLVDGLGADEVWSKIFGTACSFLVNFIFRQFWVFDKEPRWRLPPVKEYNQNRNQQNDD